MYRFILICTLISFSKIALAYNNVRIIGSSTVYPFMATAAEEFGKKTGNPTPIVESIGTGGGLDVFCKGNEKDYADIASASRQITSEELAKCQENGVTNLVELKIGYDGIVLANMNHAFHYYLSSFEIYLAVAKYIPSGDQLILNPYKYWNQINPGLPAIPIRIYGPPKTSGTRDVFQQEIMIKNCVNQPAIIKNYDTIVERRNICSIIREDNAYLTMGENDNLIVHKLVQYKDALGIFGYSFLSNNIGFLHGTVINGIAPNSANIEAGLYPLSRPLYVYVKTDHYKTNKYLKPFIKALVSKDILGINGALAYKNMIPLSRSEYKATRSRAYKSFK